MTIVVILDFKSNFIKHYFVAFWEQVLESRESLTAFKKAQQYRTKS